MDATADSALRAPSAGDGTPVERYGHTRVPERRLIERAIRRNWLQRWTAEQREELAEQMRQDALMGPTVKDRVSAARVCVAMDRADLDSDRIAALRERTQAEERATEIEAATALMRSALESEDMRAQLMGATERLAAQTIDVAAAPPAPDTVSDPCPVPIDPEPVPAPPASMPDVQLAAWPPNDPDPDYVPPATRPTRGERRGRRPKPSTGARQD